MIDTIVLLLSPDMYQITDPDRFVPNARWATNSNTRPAHAIQSKQNPTKKDLLNSLYKPRLTLAYRSNTRNSQEIILKIELSLPKLFYGNNFQELKGKDLAPLLQKLSCTLNQMGVIVAPSSLVSATVSAVHYSKNIPLTDGRTPYHYITKIKEANIKLSLDVNQTDYRNEGHSFKWHCNSYEVVFYDKIKDLEKALQSEKRAIEKDNAIQLNIFKKFATRKKFEILRMEVRLNKRQKIKQLLNKLGIKSNLTLKSLFKPSISKKVLLHYLDELESKRPPLLDYKATNDKALLTDLILNNPDVSPKRLIQMFGLAKILETINLRELRIMFTRYGYKAWYSIMADAKEIALPHSSSQFKILRDFIIKFKPLLFKKTL